MQFFFNIYGLLFLGLVSSNVLAYKKSRNFDYETLKPELTKGCRNFIENVAPAAGFDYDWIEVRENVFDSHDTKKIKVFYFWNRKISPESTPVSFYPGGPGSATTPLFNSKKWLKTYSELFADLNMIYIDQRGTAGCSEGLPSNTDAISLLRYRNYFSRGIVHDSEAVRKDLLGESPWIVIGSSFGALIAQRYISLYPDSLKAALTHGYTPRNNPEDYAHLRIESHGRIFKKYFKKYPQDEVVLRKAREWTAGRHLTANGVSVAGLGAMDVQGLYMGIQTSWPRVHEKIQGLLSDDGEHLNEKNYQDLKNSSAFYYFGGTKEDSLNVLFNRFEAYAPRDKSLTEFYQRIFDEYDQTYGENPMDWPIGEEARSHIEFKGKVRYLADQVDLKFLDPLTVDSVIDGLRDHPTLKFYLYGSQLDTLAPPEAYQDLVAAAQGEDLLTYTLFKKSGHEGFLTEPLIRKTLREEAQRNR